MPDDEAIRQLLRTARTIAVVGLSSNPMRPSFGVSEYMQSNGYRIIPVNPNEREVLGVQAMSSLGDISEPFEIVDIFRRPEFVPDIVEQAIEKGARCIWMQEGVVHSGAAKRAEAAGLMVIMDRCIYREHRRLLAGDSRSKQP